MFGLVFLHLRSLLLELNAAEEVPDIPVLKIYVVALMQWQAEKVDPSRLCRSLQEMQILAQCRQGWVTRDESIRISFPQHCCSTPMEEEKNQDLKHDQNTSSPAQSVVRAVEQMLHCNSARLLQNSCHNRIVFCFRNCKQVLDKGEFKLALVQCFLQTV